MQVACVGDIHACPVHGTNAIVEGGSATVDGRPVARVGDKCGCGCVIIEGASGVVCDGKPVARLGCKTTFGGVITACAGSAIIT